MCSRTDSYNSSPWLTTSFFWQGTSSQSQRKASVSQHSLLFSAQLAECISKQWDKLTVTKTWGFACDSVADIPAQMSLLSPSCQLCGFCFVVRQVGLVKQLKTNKARLKALSPSLLMTLNWVVRWTCEKWQRSCRDTWMGWKSGLARTVWGLFNKTRGKVLHLGQHNPRTY